MKYFVLFFSLIIFSEYILASDTKKRKLDNICADDNTDMRDNLDIAKKIENILMEGRAQKGNFLAHYPYNRLIPNNSDYCQEPIESNSLATNLNFPSKTEQTIYTLKRKRDVWETSDISFATLKAQFESLPRNISYIFQAFLFAAKGEFGVKEEELGIYKIYDQKILFETIVNFVSGNRNKTAIRTVLKRWLNNFLSSDIIDFTAEIKEEKMLSYISHRERVYNLSK